MNAADPLALLNGRAKNLDRSKFAYSLEGDGGFGMDVVITAEPEVNEAEMSFTLPFADGRRRDGVGDLLEVGGIDCERHRKNPVALFDHGKQHTLPIGKCEDPKTGAYTVEIDPVSKVARAKVFVYQDADNDHAVFCEQLFDLWRKKFIRGGSIGYQVKSARELPPDYETGTPKGLHLLATLMLECSMVVMPANQDTVKGLRSVGDLANEILALPKVCGKALSPVLVKSLATYAAPRKAQVAVPLNQDLTPTDVPPAKWKPGVGAECKNNEGGAVAPPSHTSTDHTKPDLTSPHQTSPYPRGKSRDGVAGVVVGKSQVKASAELDDYPAPREDAVQIKAFRIFEQNEGAADDGWYYQMEGESSASGPFQSEGDAREVADNAARERSGEYETRKKHGGTCKQGQTPKNTDCQPKQKAIGLDDAAILGLIGAGGVAVTYLLNQLMRWYHNIDEEEFWSRLHKLQDQGVISVHDGQVSKLDPPPHGKSIKTLRSKYGKKQLPQQGKGLGTLARKIIANAAAFGIDAATLFSASTHDHWLYERIEEFFGVPESQARDALAEIKREGFQVGQGVRFSSTARVDSDIRRTGGYIIKIDPTNRQFGRSAPYLVNFSSPRDPNNEDVGWFSHEDLQKALPAGGKKHWQVVQESDGWWVRGYGEPQDDLGPFESRNEAGAAWRDILVGKHPMLGKGQKSWNDRPEDMPWFVVKADERTLYAGPDQETAHRIAHEARRSGRYQGVTLADRGGRPVRVKGQKSLDLASVRKKYRSAKGLRRRLKKSSPGAGMVHVDAKDLEAARKFAEGRGLKFAHLASSGGLAKVKLIGDDEGIDAVAKEFGRRRFKALTKSAPVTPAASEGVAARLSNAARTDNPYPPGGEDWAAWDGGWQMAGKGIKGLAANRKFINPAAEKVFKQYVYGMITRAQAMTKLCNEAGMTPQQAEAEMAETDAAMRGNKGVKGQKDMRDVGGPSQLDLPREIRRNLESNGFQLNYAKPAPHGGFYLYLAPGSDLGRAAQILGRVRSRPQGDGSLWVDVQPGKGLKSLRSNRKLMDFDVIKSKLRLKYPHVSEDTLDEFVDDMAVPPQNDSDLESDWQFWQANNQQRAASGMRRTGWDESAAVPGAQLPRGYGTDKQGRRGPGGGSRDPNYRSNRSGGTCKQGQTPKNTGCTPAPKNLNAEGRKHMTRNLNGRTKALDDQEDVVEDQVKDLSNQDDWPYGLQVAHRIIEDHKQLLQDYDELNSPYLEHEHTRKALQKQLEGIAGGLDEWEAHVQKHYPDYAQHVIGDTGAKDMTEEEVGEVEGELDAMSDELEDVSEDVGEEFDDTEESKDMDTMDDDGQFADSSPDEGPSPEEALEGTSKRLRNGRTKTLRVARRKSACPCGKEPCECDNKGFRRRTKDAPQTDDPEEPDMVTDPLGAPDSKAEPELEEPDMVVNDSPTIGEAKDLDLDDRERGLVGEASSHAKSLAGMEQLDEEARFKSYHYHKALEGMAQIQDVNEELNGQGKGEFAGDLGWLAEEGAEAEHGKGLKGKAKGVGDDGMQPGNTDELDAGLPPPAPPAPDAPKSMHPHRQACKDASVFFGDAARTKDWGEQHRQDAQMVAKALDEITAAGPADKAPPPPEEEGFDVGEMGEKSRKKSHGWHKSADDEEDEKAKAIARKALIEQQKQVKALRQMLNGISNLTR